MSIIERLRRGILIAVASVKPSLDAVRAVTHAYDNAKALRGAVTRLTQERDEAQRQRDAARQSASSHEARRVILVATVSDLERLLRESREATVSAVERERERCAKICETSAKRYDWLANKVLLSAAENIRNPEVNQ